ncbi:hypothetical protein FXO38_20628 [Capsicum annuum]|uniref:Uncharacterized protein n=1 Tax=Capsicum annuum TaxID=4072 RepID=A0A2G2YAM8_CAPAN|nr:hypothetical protein FXO38_20628 [Capsicum annuum]KAF3646002.1 hypothetical protein FXO37_20676 [Capsicum annuum]PHT66808.1 hypothetical protein T459_31233 [Capsicum annuum]
MEHLIKLISYEPVVQVDCREIIDFDVVKLKKKETVVAPVPLSIVEPVAALVQTGLMLGFRKSNVNVVVAGGVSGGAIVGDIKWKDAFGSMKNGISSSSFL